MRYKYKNNHIYIFYISLFLIILLLSVGFSAFNNSLSIDNIKINFKEDKDIRVTNISVNSVHGSISNYNDNKKDSISGGIILNNKDSYVIYDVEISNFGNILMGISNATIDNDNLDFEFVDYKLKDKICENDNCTLGIKKIIKIKIFYKDTALVNDKVNDFTIKFEFGRIYSVSYINIENSENYLKEIIEGDTLNVNIPNNNNYFLKVFMNDKLLNYSKYEYVNDILKIPDVTGNIKIYFSLPTCKRAEVLHTEECVGRYCKSFGYKLDGNFKTTTITYGFLGTKGVLKSGDAFDCDVNGDGVYDSIKERFYYVTTLVENENIAVLIYYNNVNNGKPDNNAFFAYDLSGENWHGPVSAITNLPTNKEWSNVSLYNVNRKLTNEYGTYNTKDNHVFPDVFSYYGYSARLLTFQELKKAINTYIPTWQSGELNEHLYFVENTNFSKGNTSNFDGYWLENPRFSLSSYAWFIYTAERRVHSAEVKRTDVFGVRPVIEVSIDDILY